MKPVEWLEAFLQFPVTAAGRRAHRKEMLRGAHYLRDRIVVPPDLAADQRRVAHKQVRRLMNRLAVVEHWHTSFVELGFHIFFRLFVGAFVASLIGITWYSLRGRSAGGPWFAIPVLVLSALVGAFLFSFLVAVPLLLRVKDPYLKVFNRLGYVWTLLVVVASGAGVFAAYRRSLRLENCWQAAGAGLATGVLAIVAGVTVTFLYNLLGTGFADYLRRRLERLYAQALIVRYLADALAELRQQPTANRFAVFDSLKRAAERFEVDLPVVLRTGDFATDYWVRNRMEAVGWRLRSMARQAIAPTESSLSEMTNQLPRSLWASAMGYWALLDVGTAEDTPRREALRVRLFGGLRTVAIGLAPLATIRVLGPFGIRLPDYVSAGAVVWALGAILLLLDPELKVLSAFRQIRDAVQHKPD